MRLTSASITSRRRTAAHPPLEAGGPDLALSTQVEPDLVVVRVSFRADARLVSAYPSLHEAVALAVDLPDLGRCESSLLTDPERRAGVPAWTEEDGGAPEQDASGPRGADAGSRDGRPIVPARPASGSRTTHHTDDAPAGAVEGWLTAHVRLDPRLPRPATLYVRALLRDACSAAHPVDLPA